MLCVYELQDAPATQASPLHVDVLHQRSGRSSATKLARSICPLPPVVMVFCAVDGYRQMSLADRQVVLGECSTTVAQ
jgi:hypothetical protein